MPEVRSPSSSRRRRPLRILLLLASSTCFAVLLGEVTLRILGGFSLTSLRLTQSGSGSMDIGQQLDVLRETVDPFVERITDGHPDIDRTWLRSSPPPLPEPPLLDLPLLAQQDWLLHYYVVNETRLRAGWIKGTGLVPPFDKLELPDEFRVFPPPGGLPNPLYRYPLSRKLPTGLITNKFGFRGGEITVDKPQDTVRIAYVGASTTVEAARLPHSAPELIQHWLNLWAEARGLETRFECINAAREAIKSDDIRAIVADEVLPLAVDYVVYYEGKNQLMPATVLQHVAIDESVKIGEDVKIGEPPPGTLLKAEQDSGATTWSALAHYFDTATRSKELLREATGKPEQTVTFDEEFESGPFPLQRAPEVLALGTIGADLHGIYLLTQKARAQLVVCTFAWLAHEGLTYDPILGEQIKADLDGAYWPLEYASIRRAADVQNRFFAAFARERGLDVIDVSGLLPKEPLLYIDAIHHTEAGVRLKAWIHFVAMTEILARDLERQRVPQPDDHVDAVHPNIAPAKRLTREQLDAGK